MALGCEIGQEKTRVGAEGGQTMKKEITIATMVLDDFFFFFCYAFSPFQCCCRGSGCPDFATEATVPTLAELVQPSDVPSAKSQNHPLNPREPWRLNSSRYHYAHFIDEEIEARRWP